VKFSHRHPVSRRDLLKVLGGAALALPALELLAHESLAQTVAGKSKFVVFCYTPDGVNQGQFWPTGSTSSYTLSPILKPFEAYKDKLLVIGPQMQGDRPASNTGLTYAAGTPQHQAPVTLTARIGSLPYTNPQTSAVNRIDGPSMDQVIAKAVKGTSTFGSLNFGLHPVGGDTPSDINFQDDGTSLKRLAGSDEAWKFIFGSTMTATGTATGTSTSTTALNKHTAVTNFLHARFTSLRPSLSKADQVTLDGHLSSLRTYEDRVQARLGSATSQPASTDCTNPKRATVKTDSDSIRTGADTETLCPFFMDMIATSFNCNLSKVATVTFGYPGGGDAGGLRMPWLGFSDPLHFVSHHGGNADKLGKYAKMSTWIAGQIAGLMDRLKAIPSASGTGTVLDETTIYWFNRHGDGDAHTNFALPNVILGGTGGYFKMGRWLQLPATSPTKVLISIANAMGVPVTSFGSGSFKDTVGLSSLSG
jgi:hypothetical protein